VNKNWSRDAILERTLRVNDMNQYLERMNRDEMSSTEGWLHFHCFFCHVFPAFPVVCCPFT
jgi:hypothetical protein